MSVRQRVGGWRAARLPARAARRHRARFFEVERYCFFVGFPRSGTTLVGQLLNAHRHALIAYELNAFAFIQQHPDRDQLFGMLIEKDTQFVDQGRVGAGDYEFAVPGQWQGKTERLRVIGDKKAGESTDRLRSHPELLEQVRRIVGVPIRVLCVTRNPFDTVATLARRHEESIEWAAERYAGWAEPLARIRSALEPDELLDVRHEDLVADPARELDRLCTFLDIDAPDEYLAACASIVFPSARRPRDGRDWPDPVTHQIEDLIGAHPFLANYTLT